MEGHSESCTSGAPPQTQAVASLFLVAPVPLCPPTFVIVMFASIVTHWSQLALVRVLPTDRQVEVKCDRVDGERPVEAACIDGRQFAVDGMRPRTIPIGGD